MQHTLSDRLLTELDHARLSTLARRLPADVPPTLQDLLDDADLVPSQQVPAQVVTMYSQVRVREHASGACRTLVVCYPPDADAAAGFVSALSPAGASLLGLRPGDTACWTAPDGGLQKMDVLAILFQPEASGDYTL